MFDFLNKGLLGSSKEFKQYVRKMDDDETYFEQLKQQIASFILRRLKTDKMIISTLPDKIENKVYALLSKRQLALYNDTLETLKERIESAEGIERKGLIYNLLSNLSKILSSSKLATSWWGKMWNANLERYAEYTNRIGRGKTYVKNGLVIDLQIGEGFITAYVQGKRTPPYQVSISIKQV